MPQQVHKAPASCEDNPCHYGISQGQGEEDLAFQGHVPVMKAAHSLLGPPGAALAERWSRPLAVIWSTTWRVVGQALPLLSSVSRVDRALRLMEFPEPLCAPHSDSLAETPGVTSGSQHLLSTSTRDSQPALTLTAQF